jgi:hypothetical protein
MRFIFLITCFHIYFQHCPPILTTESIRTDIAGEIQTGDLYWERLDVGCRQVVCLDG